MAAIVLDRGHDPSEPITDGALKRLAELGTEFGIDPGGIAESLCAVLERG